MILLNNDILQKIEIDKKHIENFQLETTTGTKRTKEKFYKNAVNERNKYVNNQRSLFIKYKKCLENEIVSRYKEKFPIDRTTYYEKEKEYLTELFELVKLNSIMSDSFKLNLDFIVSSITDDTSLEDLNAAIRDFINNFDKFNVKLDINDFKYTMFTEMYMKSYFEDKNMRDTFDSIYFKCPDIKLQLKMNLKFIISKYKNELNSYVSTFKSKMESKYNIKDDEILSKYVDSRVSLGSKIAMDEFYNTNIFLNGTRKITDFLDDAGIRSKNYNLFASNGNYNLLDDKEKESFNSEIMSFYLTLSELKKYYKYEFIITDLLAKYKDRVNAKSKYDNLLKEIKKEEGTREKIYKNYLKSLGIGFLSRKNSVNEKNAMLNMNEQIKKLDSLYTELNGLEISVNLNSLNESSSIYDLFICSLTSFSFLEGKFSGEDFSDKSLMENVQDYLLFIYNPNNDFLREINALIEFDIASIVADKYRLLNLNVNSESINVDNIDSNLDAVLFINLIQNIEKSNISIDEINYLCQMKKIIEDENIDLDLI